MIEKRQCEALVVGGGPGGYAAAIRLGKLGVNTILVEGDKVGGTCLIRGCIPSKALIEASHFYHGVIQSSHSSGNEMGISIGKSSLNFSQTIAWKDGIVKQLNQGVKHLVKAAKVDIIQGWATFKNAKTCEVKSESGVIEIESESVVLATGSTPIEIPSIPFGENIIDSESALDLKEVPKKLLILGAGYIGVELGFVYQKMGAEVTFIEGAESILPGFDKSLRDPVHTHLKELGADIIVNAKATAANQTKASVSLNYIDNQGKEKTLKANKLLVTVGRKPNTQGWGIENMAIDMNGAFIKVNNQCKTVMKGVYAIGDLTGEPMLAHKATAQGELVAEVIAGHHRVFEPSCIPAICYTDPEIFSIGMNPEEAKQAYGDILVGQFPLAANGRTLTMNGLANSKTSFVRIVARQDNQLIIGIQAVGDHISELSGESVALIEMAATLEDVAGMIHGHPTISEAILEACLLALGRPIHVT